MQISVCMAMAVPSSHKTHQPWILGCRMEQYGPSALRASSSVLPEQANPALLTLDMTKELIRKMFSNVELSVSSYDTAWVAMVPCPKFPKSPHFPECLNWVMDNQLNDGSWDPLHHDPRLLKDSLNSTLACIIALKRWNVGEDQINKGLHFIETNLASAADKNQPSPFGFEVIFPGMLEYAKDLNIELPLWQTDLSLMLHERELQLKRCDSKEMEAYLAYISEGLGNFTDWNMVMKYQMENGSLFNSPSGTAAAVIHHQNAGCLSYLTSLLEKFGNAVPTVYPFDLYARLCMVDTLERLGITRHFRAEIQNVLDVSYKRWMQRDEQMFMDIVTCALAFRLLRINGYEVSSDPLAEITKGEFAFGDVYAALEVHRASQIVYQEEFAFGELNVRSTDFLERKKSSASVPSNRLCKFIHKEVGDTLKFPYNSSLERISTKRNIENYNVDNTRILKTVYRSTNIGNKDYLRLAVEDFNACQSICREELKGLERWVVEFRLDKLKFARQKTAYCYFSAASTLSSPELSDARISWGKSSILTTVIDDFFDVGGSMDELVNLIQCVEKWDVNVEDDCCSEAVVIVFSALKDAICWIGDNAFKWQAREVTGHVIETWLDLMRSMLREAMWARDDSMPTIKEYMENGYVSFALGPIVLPALYFVGPKLSEEIVESSEYHKLYKLMSTYGRLWNDIRSFKRELEAGKLNAVALHMNDGKSGEEVVEELKMVIDCERRELMKLVLEANGGSVVPRACKDVFWNMCNVLKLFYAADDGFSGNAILNVVKEIIYEPVSHQLILVNGTQEKTGVPFGSHNKI